MPLGAGLASSGLSAGASIIGGINSTNAENAATKAAQGAADKNNATAGQVYQTDQNNLQPTTSAGLNSTSALEGLLGLGSSDQNGASDAAFNKYLGSTNYQFGLNQGENAIEYANAPSFNSGGTAKALDSYATAQAQNALQGYEGQLNTVSGQGLTAAGTLANAGTQYAGQVASNNNNAAGVAGSAAIGSANAQNGALSNLTSSGISALSGTSFGQSGSSGDAQASSDLANALTGY